MMMNVVSEEYFFSVTRGSKERPITFLNPKSDVATNRSEVKTCFFHFFHEIVMTK